MIYSQNIYNTGAYGPMQYADLGSYVTSALFEKKKKSPAHNLTSKNNNV